MVDTAGEGKTVIAGQDGNEERLLLVWEGKDVIFLIQSANGGFLATRRCHMRWHSFDWEISFVLDGFLTFFVEIVWALGGWICFRFDSFDF
jgi:hypothetical protein